MKWELSNKAKADIINIIQYTDNNFGEDQTEIYIGGLYNSFEILTDNPQMGRRFDETRRRYIYRSHQVYYRLHDDYILIVEIRNSRQSPPDYTVNS